MKWEDENHEFIKSYQRRLSSPHAESKPSEVTDIYWIHAERKAGEYPGATGASGKWLVFVDVEKVDEIWTQVKKATEEGKLGDSSKVATARPNSNATDQNKKVICVYTYDWTDEDDVRRVREELRQLGVTRKIPYKADQDTMEGKYRKTGHTRISKYYE